MNIQGYLQRIGIASIGVPNLQSLNLLQQQHLLYIPFENLDIHLGKEIELDYDKIYKKVVLHRRGGFCYELNGLFYLLLKDLGFQAKRISARVLGSSGKLGQEYDHLAIIVTLDSQDWLVDVGFGKFSFQPLKLVLNEEQIDQRGAYKIKIYDDKYQAVYIKSTGGDWKLAYIFTQKERSLSEFEGMVHYHQTSPKSNFTKRKLCTKPNLDGRITLTNEQLKIEKNGTTTTLLIKSEEMFRQQLIQYFDMDFEY